MNSPSYIDEDNFDSIIDKYNSRIKLPKDYESSADEDNTITDEEFIAIMDSVDEENGNLEEQEYVRYEPLNVYDFMKSVNGINKLLGIKKINYYQILNGFNYYLYVIAVKKIYKYDFSNKTISDKDYKSTQQNYVKSKLSLCEVAKT